MNTVVAMKQIADLQQLRIRNLKPVFDDLPLTFGSIDRMHWMQVFYSKRAAEEEYILHRPGVKKLKIP